jgi:hypothetical protein
MIRRHCASLLLIMAILSLAIQDCAAFAGEPLRWFADGRPTLESWQAVRMLEGARSDGLNPR